MKKTMNIEGMTCNHCVMRVKKAIESVKGVSTADVALDSRKAVVTLTENVDDSILRNAVEKMGYAVSSIKQ